MNREVKFKYLYTNGKEWITKVFTLEEIVNGAPFEVLSDSPFPGIKNYKHVGQVQWTGRIDKHQREIYEGDIRGGTYFCDNEQVSTLDVIEWDNDGMCFWWRRLRGGSMPDFIQTEIIGNIYQHPKLLNE